MLISKCQRMNNLVLSLLNFSIREACVACWIIPDLMLKIAWNLHPSSRIQHQYHPCIWYIYISQDWINHLNPSCVCVCVLWMFVILVDWFLIMNDANSWQFHPRRIFIDCLSKQRPMFVLFENQMWLATQLALRTILLWGTCALMLLFNVASMLDHYCFVHMKWK